ncbi:DASH family cryptochrome [Rasiella sp. SM2506]|uniref:DASH family cryptochrome n=1 Tax=Rasiella sp. SM2506 TaxID=3423914 RepID=UPI003D79F26A
MKKKNSLVWFKNDLRVHDNEILCKAIASGDRLVFLYVIDVRLFQKLALGFRKAGANRVIFLKQSVENLQQNLEKIGGHLSIEVGLPEEVVAQYVSTFACNTIYGETEYAWEELEVLKRVQDSLNTAVEMDLLWGKTLYHKDDIPFTINTIPLSSKAYRIPVSKQTAVREPFLPPAEVRSAEGATSILFPPYRDLGFSDEEIRAAQPYVRGGETAGLERLHTYTFETEQLTQYRWTRNRSLGMDYSSKFSPYLALGCVSPRTIYQKVKQYEQRIKKNQSTWWLVFELVWRDYFTFKGMRMGNQIFKTDGFRNKQLEFTNHTRLFQRWCEGTTGIPFIDAHMRQLNTTGYMSNRGRVNCASFLVHDYKIDWTWGAAYFESRLIDYDVSANWMNWHMQAYEIWYTNPVNQQLKYNAKEYIQKWIPELSHIETNAIYIPWHKDVQPLKVHGYPEPAEVFSKWARAINLILKSIEA